VGCGSDDDQFGSIVRWTVSAWSSSSAAFSASESQVKGEPATSAQIQSSPGFVATYDPTQLPVASRSQLKSGLLP